ncbi:N-acetyltransferase [bacterium]|nr:N-acetyltransferase [bacterium]
MMCIRPATLLNEKAIRGVYLSAFPEGENQMIAELAVNLLLCECTPEIVSLVAEKNNKVVAHTAFSPVIVNNDESFRVYILSPLGVMPHYQNGGLGTKLIEKGKQDLSAMGVDVLLVYGDPMYYGRFGFGAKVAERYIPPFKLNYPHGWLGAALNNCDIGKPPVQISCVNALSHQMLW